MSLQLAPRTRVPKAWSQPVSEHRGAHRTEASGVLKLERLRSTPVEPKPFHHVVVSDFIASEAADAISSTFPGIAKAGAYPLSLLPVAGRFKDLIDALQGAPFRQIVESKMGIDLTARPAVITVRGMSDAQDGTIHTDSASKLVTVLLYLNQGWSPSVGRLRLLRNGSDIGNYTREIEPDFGNLLIFRRSDVSWHGHLPFVGQRRVLQMNWLTSTGSAWWHDARRRLSVALKER